MSPKPATLPMRISLGTRTLYGERQKRVVWDAKWGPYRAHGYPTKAAALEEIQAQITWMGEQRAYMLRDPDGVPWVLYPTPVGWEYQCPGSRGWTCLGRVPQCNAIEAMYNHAHQDATT